MAFNTEDVMIMPNIFILLGKLRGLLLKESVISLPGLLFDELTFKYSQKAKIHGKKARVLIIGRKNAPKGAVVLSPKKKTSPVPTVCMLAAALGITAAICKLRKQ